jgi:hypothetical protein
MSLRLRRALLAVLALSAALVGGWATVAARSFYDSFPGAGRHWVAMDGPYNEHLVRDVGGLYLALLVVSLWALCQPQLGRLAGISWLVFSVPHLIYHASHLDMFGTADKIGNIVSLGGTAAVAAALAAAPHRGDVTAGAAVSSSH